MNRLIIGLGTTLFVVGSFFYANLIIWKFGMEFELKSGINYIRVGNPAEFAFIYVFLPWVTSINILFIGSYVYWIREQINSMIWILLLFYIGFLYLGMFINSFWFWESPINIPKTYWEFFIITARSFMCFMSAFVMSLLATPIVISILFLFFSRFYRNEVINIETEPNNQTPKKVKEFIRIYRDPKCSLCQELYDNTSDMPVIALMCGHVYHETCSEALIKNSCPICRTEIIVNID